MGKYNSITRQFNLDVSFQYVREPGEAEFWYVLFEQVSRILNIATNGGHSIGNVSYSDNSMGADNADILVWSPDIENGEPDIQNNSTKARLWNAESLDFSRHSASVPSILAHELCHYLYDLGDEYIETDDGGIVNGCQKLGGTEYCLMESYDVNQYTHWGRRNQGPGDSYRDWPTFFRDYKDRKTELHLGMPLRFCYPGNNYGIDGQHDPSRATRQNRRSNQRSCWEYIADDSKHNYLPYGLKVP